MKHKLSPKAQKVLDRMAGRRLYQHLKPINEYTQAEMEAMRNQARRAAEKKLAQLQRGNK